MYFPWITLCLEIRHLPYCYSYLLILGAVFLCLGVLNARKKVWLIENGILIEAKQTRSPYRRFVNKMRYHYFTYSFTSSNGEEVSFRKETIKPRIYSGKSLFVVCLANEPKQYCILEDEPYDIRKNILSQCNTPQKKEELLRGSLDDSRFYRCFNQRSLKKLQQALISN